MRMIYGNYLTNEVKFGLGIQISLEPPLVRLLIYAVIY